MRRISPIRDVGISSGVGENEVYELFQSGYAGVPYDPEASQEEVVDERIYKINALGQHELIYDPGEEVKQVQKIPVTYLLN